ncbi:NAD(P)-dependent oxidoreductase [Martelella radicis]|uniref:3-hydroxyisobutyrate dehydrogenase n=1 Tax=Martelella radicis TaxID=1397476 RepID=A0A7W6KKY0_9HYPH|nr:NAD(P)-dependent oxidoreductase [Martelella radicis]MBB4123224.1 3-hydroxyisobutyrate dehydrogenase [Martelella radicis]
MRIGFAGLGRMGAAMARNLVRAGHDVTVWNRSAGKATSFATETGARAAETPRDLADDADIVITMLADDAASDTVHFGEDGLFSGKRARWFVEMGTMSPDHIKSLATRVPDGATMIDAPVSGATQAAEDAALLIMAGCDAETGAPLRPVFDALGKRTIFLGESGRGAVMKLSVNSLLHGINQTLAEAMTLAEAAGIQAEAAFDVIEASAAAAPMLKYRRPLYLDETAHDVTFTVALARKDMAVTAALAERLGTAMPQGLVTLEKLTEAERAGYGARDMASILNFMRKEQT